MSVTPRGMSVQEAYRLYREGQLLVNRRYQRKLVWTVDEKQKLVGSILKAYPIPLILLAERPDLHGAGKVEIVDGMQRLNAIVSFIENGFTFGDRYFAVSEFARAAQNAKLGIFVEADATAPRLTALECANILDYQLAVTIYPATDENEITDVFGRINSGGRQLSNQERRQAGVVTAFADLVRVISAEIRGDASMQVLSLADMPEISVDSGGKPLGYGVRAEETLWCKQGILSAAQLRGSEDEEIVADLAASILTGPIPASREYYDEIYDAGRTPYQTVEASLAAYGPSRLRSEIKTVFSVLREIVEETSADRAMLRKTVNPGSGNPIKTAFYSLFMALFDLVVRQERSPERPDAIMAAMRGLQAKLTVASHYSTVVDRTKNIDLTKGLIERHFVRKDPPVLRHGPGLAIDLENSLRRSRIETSRYECKQGLLRLSLEREFDVGIVKRLAETTVAIGNLSPQANGFLFIGVADSKDDADRVTQLDGIAPIQVGERFVVGVEREAVVLKITLEAYLAKFISEFRKADISEPIKTQVLGSIDVVMLRGLSVIRITVPPQKDVSYSGGEVFTRSGSSTEKVGGAQAIAVARRFSSAR